MLKRYYYFLLLGILYVSCVFAIKIAPMERGESNRRLENGEAVLASGYKLKLCQTNFAELELINGISDDFASRLLAEREKIQARANELPLREKHRALELVHGIGKAKAIKFSKYISLKECK